LAYTFFFILLQIPTNSNIQPKVQSQKLLTKQFLPQKWQINDLILRFAGRQFGKIETLFGRSQRGKSLLSAKGSKWRIHHYLTLEMQTKVS